jgi:hypothetical protein
MHGSRCCLQSGSRCMCMSCSRFYVYTRVLCRRGVHQAYLIPAASSDLPTAGFDAQSKLALVIDPRALAGIASQSIYLCSIV